MKVIWSALARQELEALRRFSIGRWGREVAVRYLEDVRDAAARAGLDPRLARPLKGRFRILRVRSHYLILHLDAGADHLIVTRVLHTAMDVERHLP